MIENTILTLIKVITALYFNDKAEDSNHQIYDELHTILKDIKIDPRAGAGLGSDDGVIEALRYTAEWMVYNKDGNYNRLDLLQRLTINLQGNNDYIETAKSLLDENITTVDARKRVNTIMHELRYEKKRNSLKQTISKANAMVNFSGQYFEINPFINDLKMELDDLHTNTTTEISGLVGKVDFSNDEDIENALTKGVELSNVEGMLNTGLIGLNDALAGGVFRGAMVNIGAITHNYKTGMLIDLAMNISRFNDPWMWDNTKKPLLLFITFENTIDQNIVILYSKIYELTHNKKVETSKIDINSAKKEIKEFFQQRGYTFQMEHYDPAAFCVYDLITILNKYLDSGFEIHGCFTDYLTLIADNTFGERTDSKIQKTYEMVRNFCYPKGITFFTGSQLSTEAGTLAREHPSTLTQKVSVGGWYKDCKSLHTKLDIELFLHIHHHIDGFSYLMVSKGKHRGAIVPHKLKHFMYKFEAIGGIIPDYGEAPRALYNLPKVIDSSNLVEWEE